MLKIPAVRNIDVKQMRAVTGASKRECANVLIAACGDFREALDKLTAGSSWYAANARAWAERKLLTEPKN